MASVIAFFIGMFAGAIVGVILLALVSAGEKDRGDWSDTDNEN